MKANEGGINILKQFFGQQQPQRFAPSQTAQMMLQRGPYQAYSGGAGGKGGGIEPPLIARKNPFGFGIIGDDVDQAFQSMYSPMASNWLNRMFFTMGSPGNPSNWLPNIFQGVGSPLAAGADWSGPAQQKVNIHKKNK